MGAIISQVNKNSPAFKNGIKAGEELISINGTKIIDVLDYLFMSTESKLNLVVKGIEERNVIIKKDEYEDLGLCFDNYLMDKQKNCHNKCVFCFIDQLPQGMRDTLYFKDDDIRLSFLAGNYITMTNLSQNDIDRMIKLKISPIKISVHTLNEELRIKMMGNKNASKIKMIMEQFAKAHIEMHCQIVVCRGLNDGEELKSTLDGLFAFYPDVSSVSVVPVGLTKHRENLYPLLSLSKEDANQIINITENFGNISFEKVGTRFAFAADELYLKANLEIPSYDFYEEFPQIENGVGLIASLKDEFLAALRRKKGSDKSCRISVATGVSAAPILRKLINEANKKFLNLECEVYAIKNEFFGETVNVAGLITGQDLIKQLKGKPLGDKLLLPSVMLRHAQDMFLDNITLEELSKELNIKLEIVEVDGRNLLNALTGG